METPVLAFNAKLKIIQNKLYYYVKVSLIKDGKNIFLFHVIGVYYTR